MNISENHINTFKPNLLNFLDSIFTFLIFEDSKPVINSKKINKPNDIIVRYSNPKYFSNPTEIPAIGNVIVSKLTCKKEQIKSELFVNPKLVTM